ncbi:MAG: MATE family efflux transporter [Planctomycetes bacterium]|nr:MATE family efflux transporter [Planctomycetota bacterium]
MRAFSRIASVFREIREALRGKQHDYTEGSLPRAIWLLAVPMVLELSMESIFAICDIYFVGRLGTDAVAAVGVTEAMLTIVYALAIGLAMATTALVARRIGEKNVDGAVRVATAAIFVGVIGGLVIGIPGFLFAEDLLRLMDAPAGVVATGTDYTRIILGFNIVVMLIHLQNAVFRGAGDPSLAMKSLGLANLINIILDPILIFGLGPFPELGMTGAAIATTTGRGIGVLYQLHVLRSSNGRIVLRGPVVRLRLRLVGEILRLSLGSIGQLLIATSSWVVLVRLVAPFGGAALAGYTIAIRVVLFAFLPAWGLSNAVATLVGQNLGAQKPNRAERSVWLTGCYNMIFLGLVMILFIIAAPLIVGIFTEESESLRVGIDALRIISYGYPFYAWGMVMTQAFNGAGDTMTPTRINFFCFWCFQIPLAWGLSGPLGCGPAGVFWSVCLAEAVLAGVAVVLFRRGTWKMTQVAADT